MGVSSTTEQLGTLSPKEHDLLSKVINSHWKNLNSPLQPFTEWADTVLGLDRLWERGAHLKSGWEKEAVEYDKSRNG